MKRTTRSVDSKPDCVTTGLLYHIQAVALANESPLPGPPLGMRNAPTSLMKQLGYGKDYSYNPGFAHPVHNVSV